MKIQKTILATAIASLMTSMPVMANFDAVGTDYSTAKKNKHIWTPGMESLKNVNNILCFVEQMKIAEMVNKGKYTALIDEKKCEVGKSDSRNKGPSQEFVIVEAVRENENSPQYAKVWIPDMEGGKVKAFVSMSKSPTETDPLQDFSLRFDMYDENEQVVGQGHIKATPSSELANGKIGIQFYEEFNEPGRETRVSAANIVKNPDGSDGVAITSNPDWNDALQQEEQRTYGLSWNQGSVPNRVLIKRGSFKAQNNSELTNGKEICLAKDELATAVWRYGLYYKNADSSHAAGEEVKVNSGFPIVFDHNGQQKNGFLGYWGLWTENDVQPQGTVYKVDYDQHPPVKTAITLGSAPGKLWRNDLKEMQLAEIKGVQFEMHDNNQNMQVEYISGDSQYADGLYQTGTIQHGKNGPQVTSMTPSLVNLDYVGDRLYLWSSQLNGQVSIPVDKGVLQNKVFVAERSLVNPNSFNSQQALTCFDRCPKADISLSDAQTWDGPYLSTQKDGYKSTSLETGQAYSFDPTDMTLKLNGQAVRFADGITKDQLNQTQHQWGIQSGMLLTSADAAAVSSDASKLHDGSITTWYEWETGVEQWNQLSLAFENNQPIVFDEPLNLNLNFTADAARKNKSGQVPVRMQPYLNQAFLLNYGGNGDLWGIPSKNVDDNRYYPAIALKDGAELTSGSTTYVVKAWEIEKKLKAKQDGSCSGLALGDVPGGLPTEIDSSLPTNTSDFPVESELPETPSVVNGVIQ